MKMSKEVKTQEPTKSNKKYIVLAIVVILGAVGIMLGNGKEDETATATVATTEQAPVAEQTSVTEKNTIAEETPAEIEPTVARIDITTPLVNADEPQFEVYVDGSEEPEKQAGWMPKFGKQGYSVQKNGSEINLIVKVLHSGKMNIKFRGPWKRGYNNVLIPLYVEYTSVKIDGEEILSEPTEKWTTKTLEAEVGKTYAISAKWKNIN